jgi:hypothetical protein
MEAEEKKVALAAWETEWKAFLEYIIDEVW